MNKQTIIILAVTILVLGGGALFFMTGKINKTPTQKVEDLKTEVVKEQENSGYNECLKQVKEQEAKVRKCTDDKLAAKGYKDGLDCVQDYNNPTCKDSARYNAEVNASNECQAEPSTSQKLYEVDCMKLLQKDK